MTTTNETYNGWTNYETWVANLWLDNEEGVRDYWVEIATEYYEEADAPSVNARLTGQEPFSREEKAVFALADRLKSEHEENVPEVSGVYVDLLNAALSEVNWQEIASALMDSVDKNAIDAAEEDDSDE